jgi:hypothetical protein
MRKIRGKIWYPLGRGAERKVKKSKGGVNIKWVGGGGVNFLEWWGNTI